VHFTLHWFRKIQNYSKHSTHTKGTETSALEKSNRRTQLHTDIYVYLKLIYKLLVLWAQNN